MKLKVNKDLCIGCGACQAICEEVFEITDEGYAVAKDEEIKDDVKDDAIEAMEGCPTSAISEEIKDDVKDDAIKATEGCPTSAISEE